MELLALYDAKALGLYSPLTGGSDGGVEGEQARRQARRGHAETVCVCKDKCLDFLGSHLPRSVVQECLPPYHEAPGTCQTFDRSVTSPLICTTALRDRHHSYHTN